jgi:hypothetical protein
MRIALFAAAMLLTACAGNRPPQMKQETNTSTYDRDVSECERQAALSSAGSKAQAFDNCMRARKQTPGKP